MVLVDRLLEHDDWATTQLLELSRDLSDTQLDQQFDIGHRTLRETFDHVFFNIAFWTAVMAGQPLDPIRAAHRDDRPMAKLIDGYQRSYAAFATFARRMRDEQRLDDTFVDQWGGTPTFGGAIVHVVLHNAEHRGEALHILERLGVPDLPEIDHALWDQTARIA